MEGFGLSSIRERLNYLGGHMEIDSIPWRVTKVILTIPLQSDREKGVSRPQAAATTKVAPFLRLCHLDQRRNRNFAWNLVNPPLGKRRFQAQRDKWGKKDRKIFRLKKYVFDKIFSTLNHKEVVMELIWVKKFYQDDSGASALEYSILLASIVIAVAGAVAALGTSVQSLFINGAGLFP
jgi:Flp pilus assembly pilin Flp